MFLRFSLATLIMAAFCLRRLRGFNRAIIRKGVIVGLALGIANLSFVLGVNGTTVSRAGFLNNLFVLIIPLLCFFLWRDRVRPLEPGGDIPGTRGTMATGPGRSRRF